MIHLFLCSTLPSKLLPALHSYTSFPAHKINHENWLECVSITLMFTWNIFTYCFILSRSSLRIMAIYIFCWPIKSTNIVLIFSYPHTQMLCYQQVFNTVFLKIPVQSYQSKVGEKTILLYNSLHIRALLVKYLIPR